MGERVANGAHFQVSFAHTELGGPRSAWVATYLGGSTRNWYPDYAVGPCSSRCWRLLGKKQMGHDMGHGLNKLKDGRLMIERM